MSASSNSPQLDPGLGPLIARYRERGILVDTNLLLLFFAGSYGRAWIKRYGRTDEFDDYQFQVLVLFLSAFERRVTTPHILTEVSNFANDFPFSDRYKYRRLMGGLFAQFFEVHEPATAAAALPEFARLGLTDVGIEWVARGKYLVLTNDDPLVGHLVGAGVDVVSLADLPAQPKKGR